MKYGCFVLLFTFLSLIAGCAPLDARSHAMSGKKALAACQFSNAYDEFAAAHEILPDNEEILLGLAVSEAFVVADSFEFREILRQLGITKRLDQLCRDSEADDVSDDSDMGCVVNQLREPIQSSQSFHISQIAPALTWKDLSDALYAHADLLQRAARHFYTLAQKSDETYELGDVFGFRALTLHNADLASVGFALSLMAFAADVLHHYDHSFSIRQTLEAYDSSNWQEFADLMNAHFLKGTNSIRVERAFDSLDLVFQTLAVIAAQGEKIKTRFEEEGPVLDKNGCIQYSSVLRWETVPYGIYWDFSDASRVLSASHVIDLTDFFDPLVILDVAAFLDSPPTRSDAPMLAVQGDALVWILSEIVQRLNLFFEPAIFTFSRAQIQLKHGIDYRLSTAWLDWDPIELVP